MFNIFSLSIFILLTKILCIFGDDTSTARLLFYKFTTTVPVVEGNEFHVTYQVINNGESTATKVEIFDKYDPNSFQITSGPRKEDGSVVAKFDEILPGGQFIVNVTVIPKLFGVYESTRAKVSYISGDEEDEILHGFSTSLGKVRIVSKIEHTHATSYYIRDWCVFAIIYAVPTLIPLAVWYSSKSANELSSKSKSL